MESGEKTSQGLHLPCRLGALKPWGCLERWFADSTFCYLSPKGLPTFLEHCLYLQTASSSILTPFSSLPERGFIFPMEICSLSILL